MEPAAAHAFRLCAIPHIYDQEILRLLLPSHDASEAEQRCTEFASLSAVTPVADGWSVHEKWRKDIFQSWLSADNRAEFASVSRRLADFFHASSETTEGAARETARRRGMYHLLGADQAAGFAEFERLCRTARYQLRYTECAALIRLVHDYDSVLTAEQRAAVTYHEGKLASDTRDWKTAERLFVALAGDTSLQPIMRAKAYLRLGYVLGEDGRPQDALDACRRGRAIAENDPGGEAIMPRILHELGIAYRNIGEQDEAMALMADSANRAALKGDRAHFAIAQNSLGGLYLKQRLPAKAIQAFEAALEKLDVARDQLRASQVYNNIGLAYRELRQWSDAESWFRKSLDIKRRAGDMIGQAVVFNNLVAVQIPQGAYEEAIASATQAAHYFQMGGDLARAAVAQQNLGNHYRRVGKVDLAREYYTEAIALFSRAHDAEGEVAARGELESLDEKHGLPWWAWLAVIVCGLVALLIVVALVFAVVSE
jgi:tetratricopeptide (TPR) repeat protein